MKIKRLLAVLLVLLVAVTPISVSAIAHLDVHADIYNDPNGLRTIDNLVEQAKLQYIKYASGSVSVNANDYSKYIVRDDRVYERLGLGFKLGPDGQPVTSGLSNQLTLNGSTLLPSDWLSVVYGTHTHVLDPLEPWYYDNNFHWKSCEECGARITLYHQDLDNDGVCDVCAQPIHYRHVTVKDVPGGKVTASREKCMLGNRVAITVTPDAGYHLQEIHGINDNAGNSIRPCFKTRNANEFFMFVDVWDIELQPTFVKD